MARLERIAGIVLVGCFISMMLIALACVFAHAYSINFGVCA